jgi:hypothetical protein
MPDACVGLLRVGGAPAGKQTGACLVSSIRSSSQDSNLRTYNAARSSANFRRVYIAACRRPGTIIALAGATVGRSSLVQQEIAREALYPLAEFPVLAGENSNALEWNF